MSCYISSNDNRFYVAAEQSYGTVAAVSAADRIPAVGLIARQETEHVERRDKTGGRTFAGLPSGMRRRTTFELTTYLTSWHNEAATPGCNALLLAALGNNASLFGGGIVESMPSNVRMRLGGSHGLTAGQAVSCGGEIRFASAIEDAQTIVLNAPFTSIITAGTTVDRTVTYSPAPELASVSIHDCWDPAGSVQRILAGAAVDRMRVRINDDFHEFTFSGLAADLLDSSSFTAGQGGLSAFPEESPVAYFDYSIVPGNIGQAWLGSTPERFYTLTGAEVVIDNNLEARNREFGSPAPRCVVGGVRRVYADFTLYERPEEATKSLYQAARDRSPVSVMFQLGQQEGQLCGVYLKSVIPEVPEFDDDEPRLRWRFRGCRAQGTIDDEIFIAFG